MLQRARPAAWVPSGQRRALRSRQFWIGRLVRKRGHDEDPSFGYSLQDLVIGYHSVTLYRFRRHAPHELSARIYMSGGGLVLDDDLVTPSPVVHMWDRMHAPIHGSSDVSGEV